MLYRTENQYFTTFSNFKHDYIKKFYWSSHIFHWSSHFFIDRGPRTDNFHGVCVGFASNGKLSLKISLEYFFCWHSQWSLSNAEPSIVHSSVHVVGLFMLRDVRHSLEYACAPRVLRTSPHGFLGSLVIGHFGYVAWEWWEFRWSNKWNWYSSGLNASILVWHTCASALSGWILYRQLELTKLTHPDLNHVVGLFILRDVRLSSKFSVTFHWIYSKLDL